MVAGKQSKCQVLTWQRLAEGTSKRWRTNLQFIIKWHRDHSTTRVSSSLIGSDNKTYLPMGFFATSLLYSHFQVTQVKYMSSFNPACTHSPMPFQEMKICQQNNSDFDFAKRCIGWGKYLKQCHYCEKLFEHFTCGKSRGKIYTYQEINHLIIGYEGILKKNPQYFPSH